MSESTIMSENYKNVAYFMSKGGGDIKLHTFLILAVIGAK
jgi:hypothetical protein